jgi:hypothetical protein
LLVLGAVAVVGVLLYNRMQERAVRREAERAFGARHADVLLDPDASAPTRPHARDGQPAAPAGAVPDERVDYIVTLRIPVGAPGAPVLEGWHAIEQRFGRRALLAGSDGSGWRALSAGEFGTFSALRAGLQMVGRAGVVPEAELIEFRTEVETLGTRLRAECSAPEMRHALEAARELDRFCADCDIQVALHVVAEGLLPPVDEGPFQVSAREGGTTLILDMPRTPDPERAYEAMARAARDLAARAAGRVVDDRGNPLDERALAAIGTELARVHRELSGRDIHPGSALALRLFS